ncbi:MAG: hypothetical protein ACKVP4_13090 [Hyphomicrobium sp.]
MKLKSLIAAAALMTAPALLAAPATAADWDGYRGYSNSWSDRHVGRDRDLVRPRYHARRFHKRLPWWAYNRPYNWRRHQYVDRYNGPRYPRRDW